MWDCVVDAKCFARFCAKLVIFIRYEFQCRQWSFYFLICNRRIDCPLLSWHALTQREKESEGGNERPFDERTEPSPPLAHFPPSFSSLPCGVNLAKRRQHQPIYTSCMQLFFCAVPSPLLAFPLSPPSSTSLFFVCMLVFLMFVCTVTVLFYKHWVVWHYLVQ